tara:strand:- start:7828 stop:8757 length:930 start_codon:yes stop_codon:yes gene_type:complete
MKKIVIGTRGSKLAIRQTKIVIDEIQKKYPNCKCEVKIIKTLGDKIANISLSKINNKGFFVKEIQEHLINKKIDIAVHSLKDMPTVLEKTNICAILKREDNRDVLVSDKKIKIEKLSSSDSIGTTSIRRKIQIRNLNKKVRIKDIRGNVDTRVKKMLNGECNALVLAAAGIKRLGLEKYIVQYLNQDIFSPAPAQGAIAIESLIDNEDINKSICEITDDNSYICAISERIFMSEIGGGCNMPFGCSAQIDNDIITISGMIASIKNFNTVRKNIIGNIIEHKTLSRKLAQEIIIDEGEIIINELKNNFND